MRRSASEIIRNLESRIARLERQASIGVTDKKVLSDLIVLLFKEVLKKSRYTPTMKTTYEVDDDGYATSHIWVSEFSVSLDLESVVGNIQSKVNVSKSDLINYINKGLNWEEVIYSTFGDIKDTFNVGRIYDVASKSNASVPEEPEVVYSSSIYVQRDNLVSTFRCEFREGEDF